MEKLLRNKLLSIVTALTVLVSASGIQAFASDTEAELNGITRFLFDGNSVTVTDGKDTNYEVVIYDSTDTETEPVIVTSEDSTTYSVPESSNGELLVSVKKKGGSYVFEGNGKGSIAVKKEATNDAVLYLNGLELSSSFTSVVTVKKDSTASCTIYVVDGTENTLTDNSFNNDDSNPDNIAAENAVMKFKDSSNVIFDGKGVLNINGNGKNGIKANNIVTFNGNVTFNIDALDNGISSDNSIVINSGTFNIKTSEGDGIKAGADAEPVGDVTINGGKISIDAYADGIQATANLTINGGIFDITCYGGYTSKYNGDSSAYPSAKALKASGSYIVTAEDGTETELDNTECYLVIAGGTFNLNSPDDAVHSDKNLTVSGGIFTVNTADDGFHSEYETTLGSESSTEESLQVNILHSYEGIEGAIVNIYDGLYKVYSSDDAVNAANGDLSRYSFAINVYGGNIYASTSGGDCFDSNADINIYGGTVVALGSISGSGGNSALDCDGKLNISGGTVIGIGMNQMVTTPSSGQAYIAWTAAGTGTAASAGIGSSGGSMGGGFRPRPGTGSGGSESGFISNGDTVTILDSNGDKLFSVLAFWNTTSSSSVNHVLFSSPEVKSGSSYTLQVTDSVAPTMLPIETTTPEESEIPDNTEVPEETAIPSDRPTPPSEQPTPPSDMPAPPDGDDEGFCYGDINGDGVVNAQDSLAALKYAAKLVLLSEEDFLRADVDGSKTVDAKDALFLLKYAAKIILMFPIEENAETPSDEPATTPIASETPDPTVTPLQPGKYNNEDYIYLLYDNGTIEIVNYIGDKTEVIIPEKIGDYPVTSIGDSSFFCNSSIISVIIPEGVTNIGKCAFEECRSMISIEIPKTVTAIGSRAFSGCSSLESIKLPNGVETICDYTFFNCTSLSSVNLPESVTTIDSWAFSYCAGLIEVNFSDNLKTIGDYSFYECDCLESITIPSSVEKLGSSAFGWCSDLKSVIIQNGVEKIDNSTFDECSNLHYIFIPDSMLTIGFGAFSGCNNLWHVLYEESEEQWNSITIKYNEILSSAFKHYNVSEGCIEMKILTEPKCTESGEACYYCPLCEKESKAFELEAPGHSFSNGVCSLCGIVEDTEN